ncbi:UNVERIFIED_CONTAM: hypothetical protein Sangu_1325600 [Sesamum angustifolium]|uniref:Uncharacterized protein n=1 Tax=Sesamum angustifolium TaxID=2727405 RepID=A0AAW2NMZ5_9LAMI
MRPQGATEDVDFELKSGLIHLLPTFRGLAGLFEANRSLVDAASGCALYDKTPTEARKLITTIAANNQQFGNTSDNPPRMVNEETRASIQNLESQKSQLASSVSRLESQGKLPSQTIINPKQNVSAITVCSEKELQFENSTRRGQAQQGKTEDSIERGHVEQGKNREELKILPKQSEKSNLTHEEHPKVLVPKLPSQRDLPSPERGKRRGRFLKLYAKLSHKISSKKLPGQVLKPASPSAKVRDSLSIKAKNVAENTRDIIMVEHPSQL